MKTLYLVRHAKSSWDDPAIDDFHRPLNERGKRDTPRMGKRLKERNIIPDLMLSSPAERALSTARRIAEVIGYEKASIKTDQNLYHAGEDVILHAIRHVNDKYSRLMIFGHNPGLTDFVNMISDDDNLIDNIPTCGVVCFTYDVDQWQAVQFGEGKFVFFDFPKNKND